MRADGSVTRFNPAWLRHRVSFQHKVPAASPVNSFGEDVYTWADYLTCHARITAIALQGKESQSADQRWAEARAVVEIHYVNGIERADRIHNHETGRYLDILDVVDVDGTRRSLLIYCKEWTA